MSNTYYSWLFVSHINSHTILNIKHTAWTIRSQFTTYREYKQLLTRIYKRIRILYYKKGVVIMRPLTSFMPKDKPVTRDV